MPVLAQNIFWLVIVFMPATLPYEGSALLQDEGHLEALKETWLYHADSPENRATVHAVRTHLGVETQ
ncbi:hypothetical protein ccbrp13_61640 [Ktedonobacteria bacterium brp13]|nr:hypothetical protein ccbrp13_61640 [Ktedonobacteria bacterium brp13]